MLGETQDLVAQSSMTTYRMYGVVVRGKKSGCLLLEVLLLCLDRCFMCLEHYIGKIEEKEPLLKNREIMLIPK